jgi:hypothetical protein
MMNRDIPEVTFDNFGRNFRQLVAFSPTQVPHSTLPFRRLQRQFGVLKPKTPKK